MFQAQPQALKTLPLHSDKFELLPLFKAMRLSALHRIQEHFIELIFEPPSSMRHSIEMQP
jgi:hypothetical protein